MTKTEHAAETPSDDIELGHLRANLPFLSRTIRAFLRAENAEHFGDLGTEHGEIATLSLIRENPGISQNDLARHVVLKKSAVTSLVKNLEERGLVARRKVSSDRRFNALSLTALGEAWHDRLMQRMDIQHAAMLAGFDAAERAALFEMLNRLHEDLAARHAERTGARAAAKGGPDD